MNKTLRNGLLAATLLLMPLAAAPAAAPQTQGAGMITASEYDVVIGQHEWLSQIVDRLHRRGHALDADQKHEISLLQGEIARLEKVRKATGDNSRTGVARQDAEPLMDRIAALWVSLRKVDTVTAERASVAPPATLTTVHSIPQGTTGDVQLTTWLSSKNALVGDRFSALLIEPIHVDGVLAIPAGAVFEGLVTSVDRAGRGSDAGELTLFIDRLRGDRGEIADVRGLIVGFADGEEISGSGADVGRTAAIGAAGGVIGALLGGAKGAIVGVTVAAGGTLLAQKGEDIDLPQGSILRVEFQSPVSVTWNWRPVS